MPRVHEERPDDARHRVGRLHRVARRDADMTSMLNEARIWWQRNIPDIGRIPADDEIIKAWAAASAGARLAIIKWEDGTRSVEDADDLVKIAGPAGDAGELACPRNASYRP